MKIAFLTGFLYGANWHLPLWQGPCAITATGTLSEKDFLSCALFVGFLPKLMP
jgi:hypothetical protein